MTILGKHTVTETELLAKAIDFRFGRTDEAFKTIPESYKTANADKYAKLQTNWSKAKADWAKDYADIKSKLDTIVKLGVGASKDTLPAEEQYAKALSHTAEGGRNGEDSEYLTRRTVEFITGKPVDFTGQPSQDAKDIDHGAYKKVDGVIKEGEKQASSTKPLLIAAGAGAAGVLALLVLKKVYL